MLPHCHIVPVGNSLINEFSSLASVNSRITVKRMGNGQINHIFNHSYGAEKIAINITKFISKI